jgi:hypothetical protein
MDIGVSKVTLSSGAEITVDLRLVTMRQYRAIFAPEQPQADEDATIARACGLSVDEYLDLPQPDVRQIIDAFLKAASQPLKDPNFQSASTSG